MSTLLKGLKRAMLLAVLVAGVCAGDQARADDPPTTAPYGISGTFSESGGSSTVIPSSGAFTHSIPFELPANRGGAQPSLALVYASGAQTGEAGLGWSLNLPSIERAPLSGWPKYIVQRAS